jgi:uroporphyrinogen decarboxylase
MRQLTSKERVLMAWHHQEPDRVPINYLGNPGITQRLMDHFGVKDHAGLELALGVDFRCVGPRYVGPRLHPEVPGRNVDPVWGIRTRWVEHESGGYWDFCDFPLAEATLEDVEAWPMPSPDDFDYTHLAAECQRLEEYCICTYCMPDVINMTGMLRTMEQVLVDLMTDDEAGLRFIDRKLAIQREILARTLEAANGGIDVVWMGEDLGTQHAPLISLDLFRRHIRARHQPFVDVAQSFHAHAMEHTCGSSSWAYDDFIAMGVTVVDTLQPEATDMSPAYLKARFGDRLAFHGCLSTAGAVATGTVDDTIADVQQTLEVMMPGGGYAFAPTHMLQDNSPTENVVAMYEAARAFGGY